MAIVLMYSNVFFPVRFSTDEGQCWHVHQFTSDPIHFTGLASEPGARSMNVSVWGYRDSLLSQYWVSVTVDFRELLTRTCEYQEIQLNTSHYLANLSCTVLACLRSRITSLKETDVI